MWLLLPLAIPGWLLVVAAARGLDALILGEDTARSLGFGVKQTLWLVICGTALAVGASVAVTGVVAFVGLVVPHLLRPWVGQRPSRLLAPSFLAGALITLAADIAIRLMPPGPELKLGVVAVFLPQLCGLLITQLVSGVAQSNAEGAFRLSGLRYQLGRGAAHQLDAEVALQPPFEGSSPADIALRGCSLGG